MYVSFLCLPNEKCLSLALFYFSSPGEALVGTNAFRIRKEKTKKSIVLACHDNYSLRPCSNIK